jgi:hypothetical protein
LDAGRSSECEKRVQKPLGSFGGWPAAWGCGFYNCVVDYAALCLGATGLGRRMGMRLLQ